MTKHYINIYQFKNIIKLMSNNTIVHLVCRYYVLCKQASTTASLTQSIQRSNYIYGVLNFGVVFFVYVLRVKEHKHTGKAGL